MQEKGRNEKKRDLKKKKSERARAIKGPLSEERHSLFAISAWASVVSIRTVPADLTPSES